MKEESRESVISRSPWVGRGPVGWWMAAQVSRRLGIVERESTLGL